MEAKDGNNHSSRTSAHRYGVAPHYHVVSPYEEGTASTSASAALSQQKFERLFEVVSMDHLDCLVSPSDDDDDPCCPDGWTEPILEAVTNETIDQEEMNGTIQNAINEQFSSGHEVENGKMKQRGLLSTLLNLPQQANGLPIPLESSRPDFCARDATGSYIVLGVGKHKSNFTQLEKAVRQDAAYMLANLYNQVVRHNVAASSVYGIVVAGCLSSGLDGGCNNKFAIVLQRMSLPTTVGGKLVLTQMLISPHNGKSLTDLWVFLCRILLRNGGNPTANNDPPCPIGIGSPALLQVPREAMLHWPAGLEMIRNGTASLVLRIDTVHGWTALKRLLPKMPPMYLESWDDRIGQGDLEFPVFFKSKNHQLHCEEPGDLSFYYYAGDGLSMDIDKAYPVKPILWENGCLILIADLGYSVLDKKCTARELSMPRLVAKFLDFMQRVERFEQAARFYHGDEHAHNMTYHASLGRFMLIDYDEGKRSRVIYRTPGNTQQERLYPIVLRTHPVEFGMHQRMMALEDILKEYYPTNRPTGSEDIFSFFESYPITSLDAPTVASKRQQLQSLLENYGRTDILNDAVDALSTTFGNWVAICLLPLGVNVRHLDGSAVANCQRHLQLLGCHERVEQYGSSEKPIRDTPNPTNNCSLNLPSIFVLLRLEDSDM